jgi:hypothetical protein
MRRSSAATVSLLVVALLAAPRTTLAGDGDPTETPACKPLPIESATTDALGARWYRFQDGSGRTTEQVVPPSTFHPLTASPDELRRYHFDDRPTDPVGLAEWTEEYRHFTGFAKPGICVRADMQNVATLDWSGIEQQKLSDQTYYRKARAQFMQPTWQFSCAHMSNEASWVGLGGPDTSKLIQAGTSGDPTDGSKYLAWYEFLNNSYDSTSRIFTLVVHPGDSIYPRVSFRAAGYAEFEVFNATTGLITPPTTDADLSFYDGAAAVYIDERNYYNHSQVLLRNFGSVSWNHAYAWNKFDAMIAPGNTTHTYDYIVGGGNVLASVDNGLATSISWTDYWHGCGN